MISRIRTAFRETSRGPDGNKKFPHVTEEADRSIRRIRCANRPVFGNEVIPNLRFSGNLPELMYPLKLRRRLWPDSLCAAVGNRSAMPPGPVAVSFTSIFFTNLASSSSISGGNSRYSFLKREKLYYFPSGI